MTVSRALRRLRRVGILAAVAATTFAWQAGGAEPGAGIPNEEAEGIIFERQQIMLQLEKDTDRLGSIVAGELPANQLAATTRAIADGAKEAAASFKQQVPGGRAKPEVWTNNADFSQRLESFATNAEAMAKLAETGTMTAVVSTMGNALPCKQCHDVYRVPKQK